MIRRLLIAGLIFCASGAALAGQGQPRVEKLKYVLLVTRHGVRSPTWTPERLNQYSSEPWPDWEVAPGNLTSHGRMLMRLMGAYYREYFISQGLLDPSGCVNAAGTYFWADTDQRTLETARALSETILPGCNVKVQSLPEGKNDALFNPLDSGDVKMDPKLGLAAVQGRIGPSLDVLVDAHRTAFNTLNRILNENGKAELQVLNQRPALTASETGVTMSGALNLASTLSEDFLLEYGNGWSGAKLGWGKLNAANLQEILSLHTAYAELVRRTPYLAKVRGSILADRILHSLEQAVTDKETKGAFGAATTSLVVITGHDTNLSNLSGLLQLSWMLHGYPADDTPPGGALVFSVWQSGNSSDFDIRVQYIAQSPDQMHDAVPLSMANPPIVAEVFVPGCSTAQKGFPCSWSAFQKVMNAAIDPAFVP